MARIFISLILSLWAGFAYADQTSITIPESQNAFNAAFGTSGQVTFGPLASRALNPALKTIASNFAGSNCAGIATPVAYQWCVDTTVKTVKLYTPDTGGNYAFHDVLNIASDGSVSPTSGGGGGSVSSVAGRSGAVTLTVADIAGALAASNPTFTGTMNGPNATLSGALNAGTATTTGATTAGSFVTAGQTRSARLLVANGNIVGDGTTDNCTPLNAALAAGAVHLPQPSSLAGYYRTSCTIIVPHGSALYGDGMTSEYDVGIVGGVEIRCDNTVTPCIQLGPNSSITTQTEEMRNIYQTRTGTPPVGSVGIQLKGGFNVYLEGVTADNNYACILLKTPPGTGSGISAFGHYLKTSRCYDAHVWQDGWPEFRVTQSRFGNADNGTPSNAYWRMSCTQHNCAGPGAANGAFITNSQFNTSGTAVGTLFDFTDIGTTGPTSDFGEIHMSDSHVEVVTHAFQSDSTWNQVKDVALANNTIVSLGSFFNFNNATNLWRWNLTGNTLVSGAATSLAMTVSPNIQDFTWTGGTWGGDLTVTGTGSSSMYIANVAFANALTATGSFAAFNETGDNISGTYTETISGPGSPPNVTVLNNRKLRHTGVTGLTCASVSAATLTTWNGLVTHC